MAEVVESHGVGNLGDGTGLLLQELRGALESHGANKLPHRLSGERAQFAAELKSVHPGVKGIGEKTAVALLEKFASIEDIFEKLERVEKMAVRGAAAIRAKLEQGREHAFLSKDLATISTKAPVKASLRAVQYNGADRQQVEALFDQLGFGRIRERIPRWKDGGNQK